MAIEKMKIIKGESLQDNAKMLIIHKGSQNICLYDTDIEELRRVIETWEGR